MGVSADAHYSSALAACTLHENDALSKQSRGHYRHSLLSDMQEERTLQVPCRLLMYEGTNNCSIVL